jgi:HEPN domain-containing protein
MNDRPTDTEGDWPVRGWFEKGDRDLRAAQSLMDDPDPVTDIICFHCQQAAEKYLKGFLVHSEAGFARVHDLRYLLNLCLEIDAEFERLAEEIDDLNSYAVEPRYPADLPIHYPAEEARHAIDLAVRVLDFVRDQIPSNLEGKA